MICPPAVWFAVTVSATGRADLPMRPETRGGGGLERLHHLFLLLRTAFLDKAKG
jgi:hypothetical protein